MPIIGSVPVCDWMVPNQIGDIVTCAHDPPRLTPFDFFMMLFPQNYLSRIFEGTNVNTSSHVLRLTISGEIMRIFEIVIVLLRA